MQVKQNNYRFLCTLLLSLCSLAFYAQKHNYDDKIYQTQNGGMVDSPTGEFTVSPMGQATYEYPIKLPEGTGSISPKLSLCYSSSTRQGSFGYGSDLSGLSMISRVPADIIHDGFPGSVDINSSRFALDGNRLIEIERNEEYITYATENNNYARIRAYGDENSPSYFVMQTKDGLTYTFRSDKELVTDITEALFWVLTKVVDTSGNYFTVEYEGEARDHIIFPKRIDYTGNENNSIGPNVSVRINAGTGYQPVKYVSGIRVGSKLISSIAVYKDLKPIYSYSFTYSNTNDDKRYYLTSISEYNKDNKVAKKTNFEWSMDELSNPNSQRFYNRLINKATLTMGDFNGDGKTDFIATPQDSKAGWNGYHLFLSEGDSLRFSHSGNFVFNTVEQVHSADYNGDGYDDIIVLLKDDRFYKTYLYISKQEGDDCSFENPRLIRTDPNKYSIQPMELNGDGIMDLFVWYPNNYECGTYCSQYNNGIFTPLSKYIYNTNLTKWDQVMFIDYNGDGITDIMNLNDKGYTIVPSDGKGNLSRNLIIESYPDKYYYVSTGDFNADGKTDLLVTGKVNDKNIKDWTRLISDGTGKYSNVKITESGNQIDMEKQQVHVYDINGDGYDDALIVNRVTDRKKEFQAKYYLTVGDNTSWEMSGNVPINALDRSILYFGDFNGDGKKDILTTSNWKITQANYYNNHWDIWPGYDIVPMFEESNNLITKITDCMGNTTEIIYKPMSDPAVHKRGNNADYPVSSFNSSWPLVYRVITPDGIGSRKTVQYNYENALRHYRGRGVLGFERITTSDFRTNAWTAQYSTIHPTTYMLLPTSKLSFVGDKVLSENYTDYILTISPDTSAVFSIHPSLTTDISYEYNSQQKIKEVQTSMTYDDFGNLLKSVTKDENTTTTVTNVYNNDLERWYLGRLTSSTVTRKTNGVSAPNHKTTYEYDSETGLLSSETLDPTSKKYGFKKTYKRDQFGNIIESTIAPLQAGDAPRTTKTTYDTNGQYVISETNSLGFTTTNTIDPITGLLKQSKDANGNSEYYEYDPLGRVKRQSNALGSSYMITGWSEGMEDAPTNSLYFIYSESTGTPCSWKYYDCLGREVRSVIEDPTGTKLIYADIVYNPQGQIEKSSDPYFKGSTSICWTTNEYDACGRLIKTTSPDGSCITTTYNGLVTTVTDPLGHTSSKEIDKNGHLIRSTDANGVSLEYIYDAAGNNTEIHGPRTTIIMQYDRNGNRISLDDPDAGLTKSEYNAFGELVKVTSDKGIIQYKYDNGGRLIKEIRPDITITSTYDTQLKGSLSSTQTSEGIVHSYIYDQYGRILNEKLIEGSTQKQFSVGYTYNSINKISTITYPSSSLVVKQEYSETGMLQTVKNAQTGHVYWQVDPLNISAKGQVESETFGNGLITDSHYDLYSGHLTNRVVRNSNNQLLNWTYRFDYNGNLLERRDNKRALSETFTYDDLNRLHTASKNGVQYQRMEYDAAGNIVYKSDVGTYTYIDGTNRIASVTADNYQPKEWDYIEYTSFNKISGIGANGDRLLLRYGPEQQRVYAQQRKNGKTSSYYYFGDIYEEIDGDYGEITKKCYIFAGSKRVALVETKSNNVNDETHVYYFHQDHLGSVIAYTNETGDIVAELSYDAWGRRRNADTWEFYDNISDANALDDYGFGDHEHIDLFEIVNMDGRMYDPVLGRFLSPDPYVQAPEFTQSFNRYAYCINNPLSLIDPTGYSWLSKNWKSIFASCVGIAVSILTAGSTSGLTIAIIAGAAGGAAGAFAGALLNGANFNQILKSTFSGGFWGAVSGLANYAAGSGKLLARLAKHTLFEGAIEGAKGGNVLHGMMMGAVSSGGGEFISTKLSSFGKVAKIAANAVLSGTVSEIGGGKFANGAITGAFSMMFNDYMHRRIRVKMMKQLGRTPGLRLARHAAQLTVKALAPELQQRMKAAIEADGVMTFEEAMDWYQYGDGSDITVDASKLNLKRLNVSDYTVNKEESYQCFTIEDALNGDNEALVYGKLGVTRQEDDSFTIKSDRYNFNIEMHDLFTRRNFGTAVSAILHGPGLSFNINFKGVWRKK